MDTFLARAEGGDPDACEAGMQLSGDLWMYWHIRGKNVTAREYAAAFLTADRGRASTVGRAGALITAGLGSWIVGASGQASEELQEAHRIASELGAGRELCIAAFMQGLAELLLDLEAATRCAEESVEQSRARGLDWSLGFALLLNGLVRAASGDVETAQDRFAAALEIQERLADREGAGMSLGGLAQLAAGRGEAAEALDLYAQSLASFEAVGDRGEEARILSEIAATHLASGDTALARRYFFESVGAHTDLASVRGVALSLVGLAAVEAAEHRLEHAVQIAAAAEGHANGEGILVVYSDETPGSELVEQARAALSAKELARATELGRRLTIEGALDLARPDRVAPA